MASLLAQEGDTVNYVLTLTEDLPAARPAVEAIQGISRVERDDGRAQYRLCFDRSQTDTIAILRAVLNSGGRVESFIRDEKHLNQAFLDLTEPGVPT